MREEHLHLIVHSPPTTHDSLAGFPDTLRPGADQPHQGQAQLSAWQERAAKRLMLEHLDSSLQISAVAQACCLSRSHFSRAFKNSTGQTPRDWLRLARLSRARELLERSDVSITQIGLECGFADQAHFTRTFSRVFGTTPKKWRVQSIVEPEPATPAHPQRVWQTPAYRPQTNAQL